MVLYRTDKAHAEFRPGVRSLGLRERTLLLLVDGRRTSSELTVMFDGLAEPLVQKMLQDGFLSFDRATPAVLPKDSRPGLAQEARPAEVDAWPQTLSGTAETASARRSLAAARMFLFDMSERMFARREPELADRFRMALRDAKDRESMLLVSTDMIATVESMDASERAETIRQQIELLLPL